MDGAAFAAYVKHVLTKELKPGDIVIMDNLPAHTITGIRKIIEGAGGQTCLPYALFARSHPIEMAFATFKAFLRKIAARTIPELEDAIKSALALANIYRNQVQNFLQRRRIWRLRGKVL